MATSQGYEELPPERQRQRHPYKPVLPDRGSIRLLRLLPNKDTNARIECELIDYVLDETEDQHLYEALSYTWGDPNDTVSIVLDSRPFEVTHNLHAALRRLRNHRFDRILWVDAICINQQDDTEKEGQIQFMAEVYAQASCVLVWLGEGDDDGNETTLSVLELLRKIARDGLEYFTLKAHVRLKIVKLLHHSWFRRIWILQEVSAARKVCILVGRAMLDGHLFCQAVQALKLESDYSKDVYDHDNDSFDADAIALRQPLQSVKSVVHLMKQGTFRSADLRGSTSDHLRIRPISALIDMFYQHEASKKHDKIYALLGMAFEDHAATGISPNYSLPRDAVLLSLMRLLLGNIAIIHTWAHQEVVHVYGSVAVLGHVAGVDVNVDDQLAVVTMHTYTKKRGAADLYWNVPISAARICEGDILCWIDGAPSPSIIRLLDTSVPAMIIQISVTGNREDLPEPIIGPLGLCSCNMSLVWGGQDPGSAPHASLGYDTLMTLDMHKSSRIFDIKPKSCVQISLLLWSLATRYEEAADDLHTPQSKREIIAQTKGGLERHEERCWQISQYIKAAWAISATCLRIFKKGVAISHGIPYAEPLEKPVDTVFDVREDPRQVPFYAIARTPVAWASQSGYKAVVELLVVDYGISVNVKDSYGRTPLSWAMNGSYGSQNFEIIQMLLKMKDVIVDVEDFYNNTPLCYAIMDKEHEVARRLLATHLANIDTVDALWWRSLDTAIETNQESILRLLLEIPEINRSMTLSDGEPLLKAVQLRCHRMVQMLLSTNNFDINNRDPDKGSALHQAISHGDKIMVQLLLEADGIIIDLDYRSLCFPTYGNNHIGHDKYTVLELAIKKANPAILRLLFETGKINPSRQQLHELHLPSGWSTLSAPEKRDWLMRYVEENEFERIDGL
ncbi:hypothetical protein NX059_001356 [Plenodomus lindquistii]|nr:hypothetical protein NX059_001356 [Plenodomus lindquistii]